jgi:hypothetical protein
VWRILEGGGGLRGVHEIPGVRLPLSSVAGGLIILGARFPVPTISRRGFKLRDKES